ALVEGQWSLGPADDVPDVAGTRLVDLDGGDRRLDSRTLAPVAALAVDQGRDPLSARRPLEHDPELVGAAAEPFRPDLGALGGPGGLDAIGVSRRTANEPDVGVLAAGELVGGKVDKADRLAVLIPGDDMVEGGDD